MPYMDLLRCLRALRDYLREHAVGADGSPEAKRARQPTAAWDVPWYHEQELRGLADAFLGTCEDLEICPPLGGASNPLEDVYEGVAELRESCAFRIDGPPVIVPARRCFRLLGRAETYLKQRQSKILEEQRRTGRRRAAARKPRFVSRELKPSERHAYRCYLHAREEIQQQSLTYKEAYDWLRRHGSGIPGFDPRRMPGFETWSRQVRAGHRRVAPKESDLEFFEPFPHPTRSIVRRRDL